MTPLASVTITDLDINAFAEFAGKIVVFAEESGRLDQASLRVNRLTKGALLRFTESDAFDDMTASTVQTIAYPVGMAGDAVLVCKLSRRPTVEDARKAGASIAKSAGAGPILVAMGNLNRAEDVIEGIVLRNYSYQDQKAKPKHAPLDITAMVSKPEYVQAATAPKLAVAEGVFFTRDLVTMPANVLTTTSFADHLVELEAHGVKVEVLEEDKLEELGMRTLLSVGHGSASPSKVVVMEWNGGGDEQPFALVGKGVVFDTGGISLKPAGGMEDMTMDMGGAGVVAGAMKALALRGAKANVVGLVGLVENMPSDRATRPGDVVKSMKGDTVEIINTDAEGRLVLADVLWYAQERFEPTGIINLATLTGAIIIGLGHEKAGVFSNDDTLSNTFVKAAEAEGEGAWRMPLSPAYDKLINSDIADIKNVGGRGAGSITAGQFLQRFIKDGMPWAHLDIAGVASVKAETAFAPKGATGWGVRALNRYIAENYEAS
ncbi:MAG: leucyl aminopeptidase [Planktomarina sp.]